jgi:hypothetical protein
VRTRRLAAVLGGVAWRSGRDRGSFTAELAAGLPALVLLLLAGLTAVSGVATKVHCADAARDAALAAARGEAGSPDGAGEVPPGAVVSVSVDGDRVTATCRAPVPMLGGRLPALTVADRAVAAVEPGGVGAAVEPGGVGALAGPGGPERVGELVDGGRSADGSGGDVAGAGESITDSGQR